MAYKGLFVVLAAALSCWGALALWSTILDSTWFLEQSRRAIQEFTLENLQHFQIQSSTQAILRTLSVPPTWEVSAGASALQVIILGAPVDSAALWSLPCREPRELRPAPHPSEKGIWMERCELPAGSYLLGWKTGARAHSLLISALPEQLTYVVITLHEEASPTVRLHLAPLRATSPEDWKALLLAQEEAQQAFAHGLPLKGIARREPLLESMRIYTALRQGDRDGAQRLMRNGVKRSGTFLDAELLSGLVQGQPSMKDGRVPFFMEGLLALGEPGLERLAKMGLPPASSLLWSGPWISWTSWPGGRKDRDVRHG